MLEDFEIVALNPQHSLSNFLIQEYFPYLIIHCLHWKKLCSLFWQNYKYFDIIFLSFSLLPFKHLDKTSAFLLRFFLELLLELYR